MKRVAIGDVRADEPVAGVRRRRLSDPLEADGVAINHYRIAPGKGFPSGLHAHMDQEELFVVLDGEATFETLDGAVTVSAGEVVRFAPGEVQSGRNAGGTALVALALGAPRDSEDVRIPVPCPDCGHDGVRIETGGGGPVFVCPDCATEHVPAPCPDCGCADLSVTLGEGTETVVACPECDAVFGTPPVRE